MGVAVLLQKLDCRGPSAVFHLVNKHIAGRGSEPNSVPHRSLHRDEVCHEHQILVDLVTAEALIAESDSLVTQDTLLEPEDETFEPLDEILDQITELGIRRVESVGVWRRWAGAIVICRYVCRNGTNWADWTNRFDDFISDIFDSRRVIGMSSYEK